MKKLHLFSLLMVLAIGFGGCKKVLNTSDRKKNILADKKWKLIAYTEDGKDVLNEYYSPCELDNISIYLSNGKCTEDDGADRCFDDEPQVREVGTWSLDGNKLITTDTALGITLTLDVLELNATTLKISFKNLFSTETLVATYAAQ